MAGGILRRVRAYLRGRSGDVDRVGRMELSLLITVLVNMRRITFIHLELASLEAAGNKRSQHLLSHVVIQSTSGVFQG